MRSNRPLLYILFWRIGAVHATDCRLKARNPIHRLYISRSFEGCEAVSQAQRRELLHHFLEQRVRSLAQKLTRFLICFQSKYPLCRKRDHTSTHQGDGVDPGSIEAELEGLHIPMILH